MAEDRDKQYVPNEQAATHDARYARQVLLPEIGHGGQARLAGATALVAGCGALGTVIAETLCRAGVGRLVIVDRDVVEWSNLQRQVLFDEADAEQGLPKAVAAQRKLAAINSDIEIDAVTADLTSANVEMLCGLVGERPRVDVIVDGLDNFETRYLLNDVAVKHAIPYVYGGAVGTAGTAMVILPHSVSELSSAQCETPWGKAGLATPDLRDLSESLPMPGSQATCDTAGVLGPVVSLIASWQSSEALKVLLGSWLDINRKLLSVDLWNNTIRQIDVTSAYETSAGICSKQRRFEFLERSASGSAVTMCGRNAVQISPTEPVSLDVQALAVKLAAAGCSVKSAPFMVRAVFDDTGTALVLTVFPDGRAIVQGTDDTAQARSVVARFVGA